MAEKKSKELYKERYERILTAISLKEPDRVPIAPFSHFYASNQQGLTNKEAMYYPEKLSEANINTFKSLHWDMVPPLVFSLNGNIFDSLGLKFFKWPGAHDEKQRLKENEPFQFVEGEYMKANEYKEFFTDPTGFILRKILPRHYSNLEGFVNFPNFLSLCNGYMMHLHFSLFYGIRSTKKMLESLEHTTKLLLNWIQIILNYSREMKKLGYPIHFLNATQAPYDVVSEFLRGMRGTMLDMYRHPEELKRLLNMMVEPSIALIIDISHRFKENNIIFIPIHRGAEGFMNFSQFEEFYWPTLTALMEGLIKNGLIPMPFFEGKYTDRFSYLAEFAKKHKGKLIYWFANSDLAKAKDEFGDSVCIKGNIPASLFIAGTSSQVEAYVKKSIEQCMDGGGYIVASSGIPDEAKAENVKAMTDAVFKYGFYRK